jgi:hypothetical protein
MSKPCVRNHLKIKNKLVKTENQPTCREIGQDQVRAMEPIQEEGMPQLGQEGKGQQEIKAKQSALIRASGGLAGESADIQKCGWMDEEDREGNIWE